VRLKIQNTNTFNETKKYYLTISPTLESKRKLKTVNLLTHFCVLVCAANWWEIHAAHTENKIQREETNTHFSRDLCCGDIKKNLINIGTQKCALLDQ